MRKQAEGKLTSVFIRIACVQCMSCLLGSLLDKACSKITASLFLP